MNLPIIRDFPKKGVNFIDIFPCFQDLGLRDHLWSSLVRIFGQSRIAVAVPESRGFLLGGFISAIAGSPIIPFRKPGKLPGKVQSVSYQSEYAETTLEYRVKDIKLAKTQSKVIIVDDVLATGNTALAMSSIFEAYDIEVESFVFLTHVPSLKGVEKLTKIAPVKILFENES